jgi:predicted transcriptional regulator
MEQETITVTVRVPGDLKRAFDAAAAENDRTASQLLRDFMREYVRKNAQGDLLKGAR